jgi:hypothetical protein
VNVVPQIVQTFGFFVALVPSSPSARGWHVEQSTTICSGSE